MAQACYSAVTQVRVCNLFGRTVPVITRYYRGQYHSVRLMSRKKQPKQATEKVKWVPRSAKESMKKKVRVIPNNWDKFLARKPEDDVWIRTHYPPIKYSLSEAIDSFRELAVPEMLDNMDGFVYLNAELNMATSKKTKFVAEFYGVLTMPHYFDDGTENKVLAFCKTKEEARLAMEEGAVFAGGPELVALIESGEVRSYMFDNAVCTMEFLDSITKTRKHIRDKFPNKKQGAIGDDITSLVRNFRMGKQYLCEKPFDEVGKIKFNIGPLNMPTEHLQENLKAFVDKIHQHRPAKAQTKGPFVTKGYCKCPPPNEKMYLRDEELIPSSKRSQKADASEDVEPEEQDEEEEQELAAKS